MPKITDQPYRRSSLREGALHSDVPPEYSKKVSSRDFGKGISRAEEYLASKKLPTYKSVIPKRVQKYMASQAVKRAARHTAGRLAARLLPGVGAAATAFDVAALGYLGWKTLQLKTEQKVRDDYNKRLYGTPERAALTRKIMRSNSRATQK